MEVDGVDKKDYWKVVDQCYLCDVCYMTKCPYVPPHEWNLDFPHLMLRAKAIQFKEGTPTQFRDKTLSSTDRNGKLATIPVVVQMVNAAKNSAPLRKLGENMMGVHHSAWLPDFASRTFSAGRTAEPRPESPFATGNAHPAKSRSSRPAT
jgi:glycerol-3-phosphate dehydrogenase subunit C